MDLIKSDYRHDLLNDLFFDLIIFNKKQNGFFVEIGACGGYINSQSFFFERFRNWNGIVVEPNPNCYAELSLIRNCNIETSVILDNNNKIDFYITDIPEWSHIADSNNFYTGTATVIEKETLTLKAMLDKFNSPINIDFISIDAEESEIKILNKFFEENNKYNINAFAIECNDVRKLNYIFENKPYIKIKNPYLNYLKIHPTHYGIVRFNTDNLFYSMDSVLYEDSIVDLMDVDAEHYYIHIDLLKENSKLKKLI